MSDLVCGYTNNRDDALIAYLYDDIDPTGRASFDAHLATCERCRAEIADLSGVRRQLGKWAPPELVFPAPRTQHPAPGTLPAPGTRHHAPRTQSVWREIPAWAQVAAAVLVLGVAAGLANLEVRYDKNKDGLTVRTGWLNKGPYPFFGDGREKGVRPLSQPAAVSATPAAPTAAAPWRADLAALEQQLRSEFRAADAQNARSIALRTAAGGSAANDAELLRRVNALIDESARKQQNELALRIAQALHDVSAQRSADLARINQSLGLIQNNTAVEILKNRESVNYLMRTSLTR